MPATEVSGPARRLSLVQVAAIAGIGAVLHLAQDLFLPVALAILITFALAPLVTRLRRTGLPDLPAVLSAVTVSSVVLAAFVLAVASQLNQLAGTLPALQSNIIAKIETLQATGSDSALLARITGTLSAVNAEITAATATPDTAPGGAPVQVQIVEASKPAELLQDIVLMLVSPIAAVGLVFVLVIFMLLERDELRDRFIRLVGASDLHRTAQVLEEAGSRVSRYLLVQLLVNIIYAVPIGLGLWLIGVPNASLWALLTLVLRFVPYIGSILSAAFPIFLAFAALPGWAPLAWTIALFVVVELVTSNVVEPWLYGSRTGLSPLAIILSAVIWTWIWGTAGLVLSTPLTVCLVVLGRHVPQFELFDILFGDRPVLQPETRLYHRLLAADEVEATEMAEEALDTTSLASFQTAVLWPALALAERDLDRGRLTLAQQDRIAETLQAVIAALDVPGPPDGAAPVLCLGGRTRLDDAFAATLAQSLAAAGIPATAAPRRARLPAEEAGLDGRTAVVLCFLDPNPSRVSLMHLRRLAAAAPGTRLGVALLQDQATGTTRPEKRDEALTLGAAFVALAPKDLPRALTETGVA